MAAQRGGPRGTATSSSSTADDLLTLLREGAHTLAIRTAELDRACIELDRYVDLLAQLLRLHAARFGHDPDVADGLVEDLARALRLAPPAQQHENIEALSRDVLAAIKPSTQKSKESYSECAGASGGPSSQPARRLPSFALKPRRRLSRRGTVLPSGWTTLSGYQEPLLTGSLQPIAAGAAPAALSSAAAPGSGQYKPWAAPESHPAHPGHSRYVAELEASLAALRALPHSSTPGGRAAESAGDGDSIAARGAAGPSATARSDESSGSIGQGPAWVVRGDNFW